MRSETPSVLSSGLASGLTNTAGSWSTRALSDSEGSWEDSEGGNSSRRTSVRGRNDSVYDEEVARVHSATDLFAELSSSPAPSNGTGQAAAPGQAADSTTGQAADSISADGDQQGRGHGLSALSLSLDLVGGQVRVPSHRASDGGGKNVARLSPGEAEWPGEKGWAQGEAGSSQDVMQGGMQDGMQGVMQGVMQPLPPSLQVHQAPTRMTKRQTSDAIQHSKRADLGVNAPLPRVYTPQWRGLTLMHELRHAGVHVAAASDNVRDHWYPYGECIVSDHWYPYGECIVSV
jgi:hypothetical protein